MSPDEFSTEGLFACADGLTCRHHADKNYMYLRFSGVQDGELIISTWDLRTNASLRMALETMLECAAG